MNRTVIIGGPGRGKSTLAHTLRMQSARAGGQLPVYCGDPRSTVVYPLSYVTYLPEGLPFAGDDGAAAWIVQNWLSKPGPWVIEGHVMARVLRRWLDVRAPGDPFPFDRVLVLDGPAHQRLTARQEGMHKGVMKVWKGIEPEFRSVAARVA